MGDPYCHPQVTTESRSRAIASGSLWNRMNEGTGKVILLVARPR